MAVNGITILVQLFVLATLIVIGVAPVALVVLAIQSVSTRRHAAAFVIACLATAGFAGGGAVVWNLIPPEWPLSFRTTVEASVNVERYGHAVEHRAENVVVWILFGGVAGALISGTGAALAVRARLPRATPG